MHVAQRALIHDALDLSRLFQTTSTTSTQILTASRILNGCKDIRTYTLRTQLVTHLLHQRSLHLSISGSSKWEDCVAAGCGFIFYTNYTSRKSHQLEANRYGALGFYWREASKSVRVIGNVEKASREESEAYFRTRPKGSQLGDWASRQSEVVKEGEVK
ncbi:hypothetical protein F5051DRAFT_402110 [Lentinula edodes]|nr:hypothetical protein F5051DRAFT_402110 [Lentinula edodes]